MPNLASVAARYSGSSGPAVFGTLRFSTVPTACSIRNGRRPVASRAAVSQWNRAGARPVSKDTAIPRRPFTPAVSAAPTVPECRMARPTLAPRLIPDSTTSGGLPKAPWVAIIVIKAGAP
jgi:hypothetical protein